MTVDCRTWEALKLASKRLERAGAFQELDKVQAQILTTAKGVLADPRREAAVRLKCPAKLDEMKQLVGATDKPVPSLDVSAIERELPHLTDEDFVDLLAAVESERQRRIEASSN